VENLRVATAGLEMILRNWLKGDDPSIAALHQSLRKAWEELVGPAEADMELAEADRLSKGLKERSRQLRQRGISEAGRES